MPRDGGEVEYFHKKYPALSHKMVLGAIRAAGPLRTNIQEYINKKYKIKPV